MSAAPAFQVREPSGTARQRRLAHALRRGWWVVTLALAVSLATATFFTARQDRVYRASATIAVAPHESVAETADVLRSLETLERRSVIATFARIPGAPEARAATARRLADAGGLDGFRIEAAVLPNTNILKIDVEGPDPARVAAVANAAAEVTREEVRSLYRIFTTRMLSQASPPSRPVHPDPRRNYVVAALLGVFLGLVLVLAADSLRAGSPTGD
jgi:capsular polysaccharide biosynthesis protein